MKNQNQRVLVKSEYRIDYIYRNCRKNIYEVIKSNIERQTPPAWLTAYVRIQGEPWYMDVGPVQYPLYSYGLSQNKKTVLCYHSFE